MASKLYAVFSEYGNVDPCTMRDTEEDARKEYDRMVESFQESANVTSDGGLCLGMFDADNWRMIGRVQHFHEGVEYIAGFRAAKEVRGE